MNIALMRMSTVHPARVDAGSIVLKRYPIGMKDSLVSSYSAETIPPSSDNLRLLFHVSIPLVEVAIIDLFVHICWIDKRVCALTFVALIWQWLESDRSSSQTRSTRDGVQSVLLQSTTLATVKAFPPSAPPFADAIRCLVIFVRSSVPLILIEVVWLPARPDSRTPNPLSMSATVARQIVCIN